MGCEPAQEAQLDELGRPRGIEAIDVAELKRELFRAILAEEKDRLKSIPALFEALEREIG